MFEDTLLITDRETGIIVQIYDNYKYFDQPVEWHDAKKNCKKIGHGWRLPDRKELQKLYNDYHLYNLIDFKAHNYWTSENGSGPLYSRSYYVFNFKTGHITLFGGSKNYFIPVKTFGKIKGLVLTNSLNEIETALFEISSSLGEFLTITRQKEHSNFIIPPLFRTGIIQI